MRIVNKARFFTGLSILIILVLSYFIKFNIESGSNYETQGTLLRLLIFHNPIVLIIYILIISFFIITGIKKIQFL